MRFIDYVEEKIFFIIFQISVIFLLIVYFKLFNLPTTALFIMALIWFLVTSIYIVVSYLFEKKKYEKIISIVDELDEKYLIAEILKKPKHFGDKAYYYALKKGCKAMNDKIGVLENDLQDYRDYVESFAHEIKTPIAAILLGCENREDKFTKLQVKKLEDIVEKMLFYARSNSVEKDYFVSRLMLEDVVHSVIMNYMDSLMQRKIFLDVSNLENYVYIDEKWITFIISQVLQNSIKYVDKSEPVIKIYSENNKNNVVLVIEDNGIGILEHDLPRVFEYGFTGSDRSKQYSTGIGLYLCKKLCDRMNLSIKIESEYTKFTRVSIIFPKNNLYRQELT